MDTKNIKERDYRDENNEYIDRSGLAADIMGLARNTLLVNLRFMQRALSHIEAKVYEGAENIVWACDGHTLYYDPMYVLLRYKENSNYIARSILHTVLHFVFHHGFTGKDVDARLWNFATDIAVENCINDMGLQSVYVPAALQQQVLIDVLKDKLPVLNAENIYKYLVELRISAAGENSSEDEIDSVSEEFYRDIEREREIFRLDQHNLWLNTGDNFAVDESLDVVKVWQDVSKRMQVELETMHTDKAALCANLQSVNRRRRSYADFLKRFGNHGEIMRLSEDEFDNNYYAYGLELYGNIPLIEHLEYREQRHIKEFVIAIDTSGSVQGEIVQSFVQRTYDLIKSQETFDLRMKLHIIQCDDRVREDAIITSDDEFDKYMRNMQIYGLGETDFRPVFEYVDKLLLERKLTNLAGLLYFTDGQGIFPTRKPAYDTAFLIRTDEVYPPEVPSWAMRLILEDDFR